MKLFTLLFRNTPLWNDPAWQSLRGRLGDAFRTVDPDGLIRCQFVPYQCPAVAERSVPAGAGTRRGGWRTFGVQDGLPSPAVSFILPDRAGHLWFTGKGRITRYDGETFVTFVTAENLTGSRSEPMLRDRAGNVWFGGLGGVTCYDGETFVTFSAADGLSGDVPHCLLQDRHGHLWFGFDTGVTRYDGKTFQTFTPRDGLARVDVSAILEDRDGILWFGGGFDWTEWRSRRTEGVTQYDGKAFRTLTDRDGPVHHVVVSMLQDRQGHLWFGGESQVTRYDGKRSHTFTPRDGLAEGLIWTMLEDRDGNLWFGSGLYGISRFDGKAFTTFTTESGLPDNQLRSMAEDEEGYLWVGTHAGLSRYEGSHWATFTPRDGLPSPYVLSVLQDRTGTMWFGTHGGLVRYDGEELVTFTAEDGLAEDQAEYLAEDREGHLWIKGAEGPRVSCYDGESFTTFTFGDSLDIGWGNNPVVDRNGHVWFAASPFGVIRYDGQGFSRLTTEDDLISNEVRTVGTDRAGNMWFGTPKEVSRYDGEAFTSFTRADGLGFDYACSIREDRKGNLWFGSPRGEVSRYDGKTFTTFTIEDGLKTGSVRAIFEDQKGHLWFGIHGAGIVRFDGLVFQDLHHRDGLVADTVQDIFQDRDGAFWIATYSGVNRYQPSTIPPGVHITEVLADRSYGAVEEVTLPASQGLVQFLFHGRSLSTPPDRMVYVYRLRGHEDEWRPTRQQRVRYAALPEGEYVFEVKTVDRDLNYSEPAEVHLQVVPDPRDQRIDALEQRVRERTRELEETHRKLEEAQTQLIRDLEEELQTAHDLQMGLMSRESPQLEGFDIAGRCLPANHVGGDIFQYFPLLHDGLALALADVTGHAMQAAIPVVMFSGILRSQMELGDPLDRLLGRLNRTLYDSLVDRTFVCFLMGELAPATRTLRLANSGCPYPFHYRAATGEIGELQVDAYPLGVRFDTVYSTIEVQLEPGDCIVFCSDGIAEAANAQEEMFGFEKTAETIRQGCQEGLSAEALIDRLIGTVKDFAGDAPQGDDMTVVVLKVGA